MAMLAPPLTAEEQRVVKNINQQTKEAEQRVIDKSPIITIPRIINAPSILKWSNPSNKRVLKTTTGTHHCVMRNNTPRGISTPIALATYTPIPSEAHQHMVTQHAINALMCNEHERMNLTFTPTLLLPPLVKSTPSHIDHFASPMVHPVTSVTISSYTS
jgi:hypothetical protein